MRKTNTISKCKSCDKNPNCWEVYGAVYRDIECEDVKRYVEGRLRVLIVYNVKRSFIDRDIEILNKHFDVETIYYKEDKHKIRKAVKYNDVVISWFAGLHTLKAFYYGSRYNKKNIVIVGGYDASDIKGYGLFSSFLKRFFVSYIYKLSDFILPVDNSLRDVILHYLPLIGNKIKVVPTGYDSVFFKPDGVKEDDVLTVCYVNRINIWRKGLDVLCTVARDLKDINFTVAGKIDLKDFVVVDFIKNKPENMKFTGWVSDKELLGYYQKNKVFALLSKYEGLPNVLCESMLCNCVPVGSNVCGIPNAIGDSGFIVDDLRRVNGAIADALNLNNGSKPRDRIKTLFPISKREDALVSIVKGW